MNQPLPTLIESLRQALSATVQPELTSDHARSQLAGVVDVLAKVERMLVWSPDVLIEQLEIARDGLEAFAARTGRAALPAIPMRPLRQAELEQALREAGAMTASHADWLLDPATDLAPATRSELDALLRETIRGQLLAERRLIPRADFGAMTAGAQRATN
ncbi:MAG: hypothetical protein EOO22_02175 [Comamonadaceae bacterium]|nr:MAG: hypothetical protein EOO22_02175 [Comamonadaceae bacterium]